MVEITLNEVLNYLNEQKLSINLKGNPMLTIDKYCSIGNISSGAISWIKKIDEFNFDALVGVTDAVIVSQKPSKDIALKNISFIYCNNPKEIFFVILNHFWPTTTYSSSISPDAVVETPNVGRNVHIGCHTYIGPEVIIGDDAIIKNNVSIEGKVKIGKRTIIHSGVIIGTDGFGYYQDENGVNRKVPHYGGVIIGDDVEIGANVCIDRGTLDNTTIGNNVKIDNLCHIAHNVIINENSFVIALSMLGGSAILEKNSYIAPGALVMNQLHIGADALVGMGAVVTKDVEENMVVAGVPAKPLRKNKISND